MPPQTTVLHVDDDPQLLELSALSFARAGDDVETVTASNVEAGLDVLESRSVDCVVSDSLRLSDGTPFIVAARRRDPSMPIVFYTAKPWEDVASDAIAARVSEYVRKGDGGDVEAVVERARALATGAETPTIDGETSFEGRPHEEETDAADARPPETPERTWTVVGVHDWETDDELVTTIVQVMEASTGVDAREAEPLFGVLDAESLETVLKPRSGETPRRDVRVRFPYAGREFSVSSDGVVAVRDLPPTDDE